MIAELVTERAAQAETLSAADYREIFDELRSKTSLRAFAEFIGSGVSFAWWSKYERGEAPHLDRERRQELRRAVGLPALPPTPGELVASVDPNARVWQVGAGRADRVVLVGTEVHEPITVRLNGKVEIMGEDAGPESHVTGVTRARRNAMRGSIVVGRERWLRLNARRIAAGQSWDDLLAAVEGLLYVGDPETPIDDDGADPFEDVG